MDLQSTKSQTLSLMMKEMNVMREQCETYRIAVDQLTEQVNDLASLVILSDQQAQEREEELLRQLKELRDSLQGFQGNSNQHFLSSNDSTSVQ